VTDYNPPISTRELDEVLSIAIDNGDNWQPDAITQAKQELKKRGVTDLQFSEYVRQAATLDRQYELEEQREIEKRKTESYSGLQMLLIFLFAPFYFLGKLRTHKSTIDLKAEHYLLMYKQRLTLLLLGTFCWCVFIWFVSR
jgi:hypothetical protein